MSNLKIQLTIRILKQTGSSVYKNSPQSKKGKNLMNTIIKVNKIFLCQPWPVVVP